MIPASAWYHNTAVGTVEQHGDDHVRLVVGDHDDVASLIAGCTVGVSLGTGVSSVRVLHGPFQVLGAQPHLDGPLLSVLAHGVGRRVAHGSAHCASVHIQRCVLSGTRT